MNNVLSLVAHDLRMHKIEDIALSGEKERKTLYLMIINAHISMLEAFKMTYGAEAIAFLKIAETIFGDRATDNDLGLFLDEDFKMVFAFSLEFAKYDAHTRSLDCKSIDEVLLGRVEVKKNEASTVVPEMRRAGNFSGARGVIKYSLSEPRQEQ